MYAPDQSVDKVPKIACITGNVHHDLGSSPWDRDEPANALEYARTIDRLDAEGTVFVTGKCARRSRDVVAEIDGIDCMEVGGHTYQAFKIVPTILPRRRYRVEYNDGYLEYRPQTGSLLPHVGHLWIILRTGGLPALERRRTAGVEPVTWRTHGCDSDEHTFAALDHNGFFAVSDVREDAFEVYRQTGDLWQSTIVGPTDEIVDSDDDNEEYRAQYLAKHFQLTAADGSIHAKPVDGVGS